MSEQQEPTAEQRSLSFGAAASAYADHRPGYPREAVEWVLAGAQRPVRDVADVGAGAGALTRTLVGLVDRVTAYEPDAAMLEELLVRVPEAVGVVAPAESLPAADGSLDAVLAAQAWHWFDHAAAAAEFGRVLRPGGVVGLLWNIRDGRVPWMHELQQIIGGEDSMRLVADDATQDEQSYDLAREERAGLEEIAEFLPRVERATFAHVVSTTPQGVLDLVSTYSYVRLSPRYPQLVEAVRDLVASHPATAGRGEVEIPYVTAAYRAVVRPA